MAFPALINIALLLFLVMLIFGVFGMSLFKNVKIRPGFDDVHNLQTFGKTFSLLFQVGPRSRNTAHKSQQCPHRKLKYLINRNARCYYLVTALEAHRAFEEKN